MIEDVIMRKGLPSAVQMHSAAAPLEQHPYELQTFDVLRAGASSRSAVLNRGPAVLAADAGLRVRRPGFGSHTMSLLQDQFTGCLSGQPDGKVNLLIPAFVGSGLAIAGEGVSWRLVFLIIPALASVQVGTMLVQSKLELRIPASRHLGTLLYVVALMVAWILQKERGWPITALTIWTILASSSIPGWNPRMPVYSSTDQAIVMLLGLMVTAVISHLHQGTQALSASVLLGGLQVGCIGVAQTAACNTCNPKGDDYGLNLMSSAENISASAVQVASFVGLTYAAGLLWFFWGFWLAALLPLVCIPIAGLLILQAVKPSLQRNGTRLLQLSAIFALSFGALLGMGLAGHSSQTRLAMFLRK